MPARIVRLPNGLLGRFSTVVDDFTEINLTSGDMQELLYSNYCIHPLEAKIKIQYGLDDTTQNIYKKGSGLDRWYRALHTIKFCHGISRVYQLTKYIDGS